jgi:hypothetical protein
MLLPLGLGRDDSYQTSNDVLCSLPLRSTILLALAFVLSALLARQIAERQEVHSFDT